MKETEKELWGSLDKAVFGTHEPDEILDLVKLGLDREQELKSSLGGFLKLFRQRRGWRMQEAATEAKVDLETWQRWESDFHAPSGPELESVISELGLWTKEAEELRVLRKRAPVLSLRRLSQFRPELLAARGLAATETSLEWQALEPEAQKRLLEWGRAQNIELPAQLFEVLEGLEDETARKDWVLEVWGEDV